MPFIGNQPALSYTSFAKQDFTTSATTSYTLDHPVTNENEIALFINFVRQEPTTAYTATGTSLTLTSATSASDDMYCVFLGKAVQTVNPPVGSVGASQISDGSIALGKLSATGTKDATTFLRGDNTFASAGGANTPYFFAYRNATLSISHATFTTIVYDAEDLDSGSGFSTSTGKYTVPEAGKYYFEYSIRSTADADTNSVRIFTLGKRTGSATTTWGNGALDWRANYARAGSLGGSIILNCSVNDVIETQIYHQTVNSGNVSIEKGSDRPTYFLGYKIIE